MNVSKIVGGIVCCTIGLMAFYHYVWSENSTSNISYKTYILQRKTIASTISATGTLEPSEIIDVGAQVAGRIMEFGVDPDTGKHLDYGSRVTKGMVLARIDPSVYEVEVAMAEAQSKRADAQLAQTIAQVKEAESAVLRSEAEWMQQKSKLDRAEREWQRAKGLISSNSVSAAEYDAARSEFETAQAGVRVAMAAIEQSQSRLVSQRAAIAGSEADVENSNAILKKAQTTIAYCSIVSPIDGIIIDRRVNQGQTVVASLSTPSLFLLASDLRELEIWVSVNEADIGQVKQKMPVRFTVDSLPDRTFDGAVKQVRLNASMSQNVVTYTVVVSVENNSDTLLPYLTANVEFIVKERPDTLCVPSSALRFKPEQGEVVLDIVNPDHSVLWTLDSDGLRPIQVEAGISDGSFVAVEGDGIQEGTVAVIGYKSVESSQASNPFVPKMRSNKRGTEP
jgi:HlyD family secretion protein